MGLKIEKFIKALSGGYESYLLSGPWRVTRRLDAPDTVQRPGALIILYVALSVYDILRLVRAADLIVDLTQDKRPMRIRVSDMGFLDEDLPLLGECTIGYLDIDLSHRLFTTYPTGTDQFMPVMQRRNVSTLLYVLAHEFGHGSDFRARTMSSWEQGRCIYPIIGSNGREVYAEAFTEFFLSRGRTTDAATLWYAKRNGWVIGGQI